MPLIATFGAHGHSFATFNSLEVTPLFVIVQEGCAKWLFNYDGFDTSTTAYLDDLNSGV